METARTQAQAQLEHIVALMNRLNALEDDYEARDTIEQEARENALSIETRTAWSTDPTDSEPNEFRIVLCTGGPHVEIRGDVDLDHVQLDYQGWGDPMQSLYGTLEESALLEQYCHLFYFGV